MYPFVSDGCPNRDVYSKVRKLPKTPSEDTNDSKSRLSPVLIDSDIYECTDLPCTHDEQNIDNDTVFVENDLYNSWDVGF